MRLGEIIILAIYRVGQSAMLCGRLFFSVRPQDGSHGKH
jgi:hypothetical protein